MYILGRKMINIHAFAKQGVYYKKTSIKTKDKMSYTHLQNMYFCDRFTLLPCHNLT